MTLFSDHSLVDAISSVVNVNSVNQTPTRYGLVKSFWASIARSNTSTIAEVLQVTFNDSMLINWMQLGLSKYPHTVVVERYDDDAKEWVPLIESGASQVTRTVGNSVPAVIPPPSTVVGHRHPQHSFVGHWQHEMIRVQPVRTSRIRLLLSRVPSNQAPRDMYGKPVDYSLAIRNLSFGYEIRSLDDVPRMLPVEGIDHESYGNVIASTPDAASSRIDFRLRTLGADRAVKDNAEDVIWRCEPQPDPSCVVSFYLDVRDDHGNPQVIDRIFLDPVNNGAHVTAYFANDPDMSMGQIGSNATPSFVSPADPLPRVKPDSSPGLTVTEDGMVFGTDDKSLIIDNRADFAYDVTQPWWFGAVVSPNFDEVSPPMAGDPPPPPSTTNHVFFDCGAWSLAFVDSGIQFSAVTGDQIVLPFAYQSLLRTTVVVSCSNGQYTLWASNVVNTETSTITVSVPLDSTLTQRIAIGSDLDRVNFGHVDIHSMVIKEESLSDPTAYDTDPRAYVQVLEYPKDEPDTSRLNAVLRFDPQSTLMSENYPWALFGGTPSKFEAMTWTPIPRDYTCQRGWMMLPQTRASYWKLEFTHLQPEYSDIYIPISQVVRRFPPSVIEQFNSLMDYSRETPSSPVAEARQSVVGYANYVDTPVVVSTGGTDTGYSNTEVYLAEDIDAAERLYANYGESWAYQQFLSTLAAPRFTKVGPHVYRTELVTRVSKIAYHVGLRGLRFARSAFVTQYDTSVYEDFFFDDAQLDANHGWDYDITHQALTSGMSNSAQLNSRIFLSNRDVRGVQFAAQQSAPRQVLPDSNFLDPTHLRWNPVGDATLGESVLSDAFDRLLPVSRKPVGGRWGDVASLFGTWDGIETAGETYDDLETERDTSHPNSDASGIVSESIDLPDGGYVYAAARVISEQDLNEPLWLQIIDSVTGAVLNEKSFDVVAGQVSEWYVGYQIRSAHENLGITWDNLTGNIDLPIFSDQFTRADSGVLNRLDSGQPWAIGQLWNGDEGASLEIVGDRATVTATGQRSVIDTETPWGSLTVQLGTNVLNTGDPADSVELIDLGGFVLLNDGRIIDSNTGYTYETLTLADDDELAFLFTPTASVDPILLGPGIDAGVQSWSVRVFQALSLVATISSAQPTSSVRGISGAVGQEFRSFRWDPQTISIPYETIVYSLPVPRDGNFDGTGQVWIQASDNRQWRLDGSFTVEDDGVVQSLVAPVGETFDFVTDVELYGAMTFQATLSTTSDPTTYYVAKLDDGPASVLRLRADGALVQSTPALGDVVLMSNAITDFTDSVTVVFAQTSKLTSAFRTAQSLSTLYAQTLIFLSGTTVISTYQGNAVWVNPTRGVMNADGGKISGFTWAPDLGPIDLGSGPRTWAEISGNETRTWFDVTRSTQKLSNPVQARVVQKFATNDEWYMDSLPVFIDPIVWEFSNDGGDTWVAASDVRNNPQGCVLFDTTGLSANRLRYRVTSYEDQHWISHVVIRPWYVGFMRGVPVLPELPQGPNLTPLDSYVPIEQDPNFMVWDNPIPQEWWYSFRSLLTDVEPVFVRQSVISERIVI